MSKWEMVRLEDVCDSVSSNIAQKDLENNVGPYPIYGASGLIKSVDFFKHDMEYIAVVKDGAGIGRTSFHPAKSSVLGTMQAILPKSSITTKYLFYAISSMNLDRYHTGSTIPHIYFRDYKKELLPLPPLEVQQQIANVLDRASALIKKREAQIDRLDLLVKSQFIEMFGDPVTNPKGWRFHNLDYLGELNRGISKHRPRNDPKLLGGKYPFVQTGDVANSGLFITNFKSTYSELGLQQSKMWVPGTLCITIAANIANTSILALDACFPDSVVGFISNHRTNAIFIHFWFQFLQNLLEEQAPESAQKNINLKILRKLQVITPPLALQTQFSDFVQQVETQKSLLQYSLAKLEFNNKSLIQKCFRGEIFS